MTTIDLGKLRFHFAGQWSAATTYEANDVVKYGGNVYVYVHPLSVAGTLPTDTTHWALMVEGISFQGAFDPTQNYRVGDGVAIGGVVYVAIADSQGVEPPEASHWSQFADGIQFEGVFSPTTAYVRNDVVTYGASVYIAIQDTVGNLPSDSTHWSMFVEGISASGVYNAATQYVPGDVVAYGPSLYRAKTESKGVLPSVAATWEKLVDGMSAATAFDMAAAYVPGQVVSYGPYLYRAKTEVTGVLPTDATKFDLLSPGIAARGEWVTATSYYQGEVVTHGGNSYMCQAFHASSVFATDLAANKWVKFNSGIRWMGAWAAATNYLDGDVVFDGLSSYICTADHEAAAQFADDSASWAVISKGADYLPNQSTNANKVLKTDGTNPYWDWESGKPWATVSADGYTAQAFDRLFADSSAGPFSITLPATPNVGDYVQVADIANTFKNNPVTLLANGNLIAGTADDLLVDVAGASLTVAFGGTSYGWRIL